MKKKKNFKEALVEIHNEGVKNARFLAGGDEDVNPAIRAQYEDIADSHGIHTPSKLEYGIGGYIIGIIESTVRIITGKENVLLEYPWLNATVFLIPVFGTLISGSIFPHPGKFFLYFFSDMVLLMFFPVYPFYMIYKFLDMYAMTSRLKAGKTLRDWEWFWN